MMGGLLHVRTLILLGIAAVLLVFAFRSLRAQRLKERYVLLFLITGLPFFALAMWPDAIVWLSHTLEIEKPTLLVLCVSVYFLLTTFELLSIVSVQDRKIAALGQLTAILLEKQKDLSDVGHRPGQMSDDAPPADASPRDQLEQ